MSVWPLVCVFTLDIVLYELCLLDGEQTFPSLISRKAAWMFTEASSVHPGLVYSFSATYRDSVVLWHIAELVAYRDNGSHLNEKRGTAL